ncbi:S-adenosyl-L-methionine-dependent methyltransferase [Rhodocollybia butyracea]|uniref:S-adenosyl-L-methionine-dependent methyltransferase n=1 Tax=Rhodocollybia butyracea TaxID=206335 RepID=A0A9P5Q2K2_9AGAR|nr:S-adenosyl-L-methionine-dependent methyltransferase [Rhodocollybia butyracea]
MSASTPASGNHPVPHAVNAIGNIVTEDPQSWNILWQRKITPWDTGKVQPPLRTLIESEEVPFPKEGRALVPGCGRGYDPIYFASTLGLEAFGLEASSIAIDAAKELIATTPELASKVHIQAADFFEYKVADENKFQLIYDYTFFVAIPPSKRGLWGAQINSLISPGGYLITLMFPYVPDSPYSTGPPFYSNFDSYAEVLGPGWEVVYDKIPEDAPPAGNRMVVWKRGI